MYSAAICFALLCTADNPGKEGALSQRPRLLLIPNVRTILQRDHLWMVGVVHNASSSDLWLIDRRPTSGAYIHFEICQHGEWIPIPGMNDGQKRDGEGQHTGRAVLAGSTYGEFAAIQEDGAKFLFDVVGTHQVRAVATTKLEQLVSDAVSIEVKPRPLDQLRRIEALKHDCLAKLQFRSQTQFPPDELRALKDTGGNIERSLLVAQLLNEWISAGTLGGVATPKNELPRALRGQLDPVTYETVLDMLGAHFRSRSDWEAVALVAGAAKYDSLGRRESLRQLRMLTDPTAAQWTTRQDFGQPGNERVKSD